MEQQRALNALEPYIALAKSASSPRAAADLITQATSAPSTYIFAELLQTPQIQALSQSEEYRPHLRLLEIFAWGTIADHNATPNLPPLKEPQQTKLLLLSLLPLCLTPSSLTYTHLQTALGLPTPQSLERLLTTAIYANLLTAHLDPLHQTVLVTSVAPLRDLPPASVPGMVTTLTEWEGRCAATLRDLEGEIVRIKRRAYDERARRERDDRIFSAELKKVDERRSREEGNRSSELGGGKKEGLAGKWGNLMGRGTGGKRSAGEGEGMDVDESNGGGGGGGLMGGGGNRSSKRKGR